MDDKKCVPDTLFASSCQKDNQGRSSHQAQEHIQYGIFHARLSICTEEEIYSKLAEFPDNRSRGR